MNHISELTITGLIVAAAVVTKEEHIIHAYCGIGGVLAGYAACIIMPVKGLPKRERWITSVICALVFGPMLTSWAHRHLEWATLTQIALAVSAFCAVFGVMILPLIKPILKPIFFALLPPFLSKLLTPDDTKKNGRHGSATQHTGKTN